MIIAPALALTAPNSLWFSIWSVLGLLIPFLFGAVLLIALYWVIRRAVAGGIRDARQERARQDLVDHS